MPVGYVLPLDSLLQALKRLNVTMDMKLQVFKVFWIPVVKMDLQFRPHAQMVLTTREVE
jgi:hypothetical protein